MADQGSADNHRCASCQHELRAHARFCDECGSPVTTRSRHGERKQVTVLFADVVGSMKVAEELDPERLNDVMNDLFNRAGDIVQRYRGTVDKFTGDGLMASFGAPYALEDHALRACVSALEIQSATTALATEVLRRDGVELELRVGVNSGEVIAGEIGVGPGRYTVVGHPVGMAQRMESVAPPGGVMCSLSTAQLAGEAARFAEIQGVTVKGVETLVPARRLLGVDSDRTMMGRNEGAMLGRDTELGALRKIFDSAAASLVSVVGEPGLGKSRLISEFSAIAQEGGADIIVARCESHTTTLAFRALSRLLRAMFDVRGLSDVDARERVTAACLRLGVDATDAMILQDVMGVARPDAPLPPISADGRRQRLVEVIASAVASRRARTVLVLEDAHWIDEPSDVVLSELATRLDGASAMLVTTYRPEFNGGLRAQSHHTIRLRPLDDSAARRLIGQLLGDDESVDDLADQLTDVAAGYPFFIEELIRDLSNRGVLAGSRGAYSLVGDVSDIAVPPTIQAVLAERIDRLPVDTKSVLNAAAVIGTHFDADILSALHPHNTSSRLAELVSLELIDQTEFAPRQRYCFHHPLVRAVAYDSQLTASRAQTHRKLASTLEARNPESSDDAALIAAHLEQAGDMAEAYRWYMRAAEWLRPRDLSAARAAWERAKRIADGLPENCADTVARRAAPRAMLISTLIYAGRKHDTDDMYREFRDLTMKTGDIDSLAVGTAGRSWAHVINEVCVPKAVPLAAELERLAHGNRLTTGTLGIALNAVAFVRFADCQFDLASRALDLLLTAPDDIPAVELAPARALDGVIKILEGHSDTGWTCLRAGNEAARELDPLTHAMMVHYSGTLAALGMCRGTDLLDDVQEALRRAESFGDIAALVSAEWACGTVMTRLEDGSPADAVRLLEQARAHSQRHGLMAIMQAPVAADLAAETAQHGSRDVVIDELRTLFDLHTTNGTRIFAAGLGEALVDLLVERCGAGDLDAATDVVERWRRRRPGIAALDLWWYKSRAVLAQAQGRRDECVELAREHLRLCESLDARGRLRTARRYLDGVSDMRTA